MMLGKTKATNTPTEKQMIRMAITGRALFMHK